jgi:hypothetical protein
VYGRRQATKHWRRANTNTPKKLRSTRQRLGPTEAAGERLDGTEFKVTGHRGGKKETGSVKRYAGRNGQRLLRWPFSGWTPQSLKVAREGGKRN